jgi:hypothetical protein
MQYFDNMFCDNVFSPQEPTISREPLANHDTHLPGELRPSDATSPAYLSGSNGRPSSWPESTIQNWHPDGQMDIVPDRQSSSLDVENNHGFQNPTGGHPEQPPIPSISTIPEFDDTDFSWMDMGRQEIADALDGTAALPQEQLPSVLLQSGPHNEEDEAEMLWQKQWNASMGL